MPLDEIQFQYLEQSYLAHLGSYFPQYLWMLAHEYNQQTEGVGNGHSARAQLEYCIVQCLGRQHLLRVVSQDV